MPNSWVDTSVKEFQFEMEAAEFNYGNRRWKEEEEPEMRNKNKISQKKKWKNEKMMEGFPFSIDEV